MKKIITLLALLNIAVFAQQKGTFTDPRDKKKYNTVKIGELIWFAQNLDYRGSDGYMGLCYGDNPKQNIKKPENCKIYGRLYDLKEAKQACPDGWHLPSRKEWWELVNFAGGSEVAGSKLKSKTGWKAYDFSKKNPNAPKCKWTGTDERGRPVEYNECATDEYGFSALPGGSICNGCQSTAGEFGYWWPSDRSGDINNNSYDVLEMHYNTKKAYSNNFSLDDYRKISFVGGKSRYYFETDLFSVRCVQEDPEAVARKAAEAEAARIAAEEKAIKEAAEAEAAKKAAEETAKKAIEELKKKGGFIDPRDNKKYKVAKIGSQIWFAENMNYNVTDSKCYDDCQKYGRIYDKETAMKICPSGWHLPSDNEWKELIEYVGGKETAGKHLKAVSGWIYDKNGTDTYGFSALPGGSFYIGHSHGGISSVEEEGYWWSSNSVFKMSRSDNVYNDNRMGYGFFLSVRCVMD